MKNWIAVFLCLFILSAVAPDVLGAELSIEPIADSYTESNDPDVNHGGASYLYSHNYETEYSDYKYYIWLKFDLSEIPSEATVNSITLRTHTSIIGTSATNKVGVFLCSNTEWKEMTITWNNCPEITGQPIDTVYVGSSDTYYDFDVTSAVKGKSVATLVLKTLEPTSLVGYAIFDSKETYDDRYKPRLIVQYTTPSPPSDSTPSPQLVPFLIIGFLAIIIVVFIIIDVITTKKKKQPSSTTTPPTSPSTPS